jgi:hypothetical protein
MNSLLHSPYFFNAGWLIDSNNKFQILDQDPNIPTIFTPITEVLLSEVPVETPNQGFC